MIHILNADNLATVRSFHGLTQRQLADLLDVSQPYIAQVEAGARPMTDNLNAKITTAIDLSPDKLAQIVALQAQIDKITLNYGKVACING
ncbi:helix-turn-helix domain-containing protein [Sporosarcina aquimarina]|uniref:helix-turn-helix domain-containing protein n=1 Tax=Sporosarcina aquimarina TaxID=114975 RepID=UPI0037D9F051